MNLLNWKYDQINFLWCTPGLQKTFDIQQSTNFFRRKLCIKNYADDWYIIGFSHSLLVKSSLYQKNGRNLKTDAIKHGIPKDNLQDQE